MSKPTSVVVLGGGYAGMLAAIRLSRRVRRDQVDIILVNSSVAFCERIRLHQSAAGQAMKGRSIQRMLRGTGVRFVQGRVVALDPERQRVALEDGRTMSYDRLIYALGSRTHQQVSGVREHALTLDGSSAPMLAMRLDALARRGGRVIVCGGGLTGIEAASECAESYPTLRVALLTAGPVGPDLSPSGREYVLDSFKRLGVEVLHGRVSEVRADAVVAANGVVHPTDLCVWAGGFEALPLAREAGLAVDERGRILTDRSLKALSQPSISVAGDAARPPPECGAIHVSCQSSMPMGAFVADNLAACLAGQAERVFSFRAAVLCVSLGRQRGLVQSLHADGSPGRWIITGTTAASIKELICRYTVGVLGATRHWAGAYKWLPRPQTRALLPAGTAARAA